MPAPSIITAPTFDASDDEVVCDVFQVVWSVIACAAVESALSLALTALSAVWWAVTDVWLFWTRVSPWRSTSISCWTIESVSTHDGSPERERVFIWALLQRLGARHHVEDAGRWNRSDAVAVEDAELDHDASGVFVLREVQFAIGGRKLPGDLGGAVDLRADLLGRRGRDVAEDGVEAPRGRVRGGDAGRLRGRDRRDRIRRGEATDLETHLALGHRPGRGNL